MLSANAGQTFPPKVCRVATVPAESIGAVSGGGEGLTDRDVPPMLMVRSKGDNQDCDSYAFNGSVSAADGRIPVFFNNAAPACNCSGDKISAMLCHSYVATATDPSMSTGITISSADHWNAAGPHSSTAAAGDRMTVYGRAAFATATGMRGHPYIIDDYGTTIHSYRADTTGGYSTCRIGIALSLCCWHLSSH